MFGVWTLPLMMLCFQKNLFYQKQCKYTMNIGIAQIRDALL